MEDISEVAAEVVMWVVAAVAAGSCFSCDGKDDEYSTIILLNFFKFFHH